MPLPIDVESFTVPENTVGTDPDVLMQKLLSRKRTNRLIKLGDEDRNQLALRIIQDFNDAYAVNIQFRNNHLEYLNNWRSTPEPATEDGPLGELSSNVKVPLTSSFIEQWKARLVKILLSEDRIAKFYSEIEPLEESDLRDISDWFDWELKNIVNIEPILEDIFHYVLVDGFALPIPYYDRQTRKLFTEFEYQLREDIAITPQIEAGIRKSFASMGYNILGVIPTDDPTKFNIDIQGIDDLGQVIVLLEEDTLVFEFEFNETIFDGAKVDCPDLENVLVKNTDPDVEKIPSFGTRYFLTGGQFEDEVRQDKFDIEYKSEEYMKVMAMAGAKVETYIALDSSREQDVLEGGNSLDSLTDDKESKWLEFYRWEGWITHKGERVAVVAWVASASQTLIKLRRLEQLNKDGKRSPVKHDFIRAPGRFYSIGLAEWLRHCQVEMDGIHNFRLNSGLVATCPFGFYEPLAGAPQTILRMRPGEMYPVKRAEGIKFPNFSWNSVWAFQDEGLVRKYASELAGMGDPGMGTFTSKRTSASEFVGTSEAIDIRTEYIARGILRSVNELLYRIFGLYQQHARGERVYHIAGPNGESLIKRLKTDRMQGRIKLILTGSVRRLSSQMEREISTNMFSLLLNQYLIQLGIVQPDTIFAAVKRITQSMDYKGVPLHEPDMPPGSPDPSYEHQMMDAGMDIQPHAGENFGMHLQAHMMEMQNPRAQELISPDGLMRRQAHIQATVALQQQVQQMRMLQAAQAMAMQGQMEKMGVRPGQAGSQEAETSQGTQAEGVQGAAQ